jgi:hypothetical protein
VQLAPFGKILVSVVDAWRWLATLANKAQMSRNDYLEALTA